MKLEHLLDGIPAEHRREFVTFLETGEASSEFLDFMDANQACRDAVDRAMTQQASDLRGFVQALAGPPAEGSGAVGRPVEVVSERLAATLGEALQLEGEAQRRVVDEALAQIAEVESPSNRVKARELIHELDRSARTRFA